MSQGDYPCPKCGSKVELLGSDCYPEAGISVECTNVKCDYELKISCSIRTNFLRDTVREAHSAMWNLLKGVRRKEQVEEVCNAIEQHINCKDLLPMGAREKDALRWFAKWYREKNKC